MCYKPSQISMLRSFLDKIKLMTKNSKIDKTETKSIGTFYNIFAHLKYKQIKKQSSLSLKKKYVKNHVSIFIHALID